MKSEFSILHSIQATSYKIQDSLNIMFNMNTKPSLQGNEATLLSNSQGQTRRRSQGGRRTQTGSSGQRRGRSQQSYSRQKPDMQKSYSGTSDNSLKIIPLGGCEEVGRNMTVFEYGQDIVILDMGLQFPEEDMPG